MIEVENLTKKFGAATAVEDISFTAEPGQVTGFLGPNGAGKTTTMRMLTGFMPPTSGRASVAGFDVFEQSMAVRQRVGYLPETVPLYRDMTAIGYLKYIAEIRGIKQRGQRCEQVLEQVGLANRMNSRIRTLSKGMRQRVGLAAALVHDPEVLILDEPTIGLDPLQVLELRELVRELGRDHTVLFSTHILSEAEQVCDKVVIINRGKIHKQGKPEALRQELQRGGRVLVRVQADETAVQQALSDLDVVSEVVVERNSLIVSPVNTELDPRPAIARTIIDKGWELLEIRQLAVSLEDIFIEVTQIGEDVKPVAEAVVAGEEDAS